MPNNMRLRQNILIELERRDAQKREENPSEEICPICFEIGADITTECGHNFHRVCMRQWIATLIADTGRKSCPVCRRTLSHLFIFSLYISS